jgi:hypothetical protein
VTERERALRSVGRAPAHGLQHIVPMFDAITSVRTMTSKLPRLEIRSTR